MQLHRKSLLTGTSFALALAFAAATATAQPAKGYYRFPATHGDTVVFTAEGDLWRVGLQGGVAQRLTTHLAEESNAAISPDGQWLAFTADYEGPSEVYVMPMAGGVPTRLTWHGGTVVGWTPAGNVLYSTRAYSTLPNTQLAEVNPKTLAHNPVPLSQASAGAYDSSGRLFFVRQRFQGSHAKRYKGGTAQNIWRFDRGAREAVALTADYAGASKDPVVWNGRIYFLSDRDGTMNLWSMNDAGKDLKQHTRHNGWDAQSASGSGGRIVYQLGADLRLYDIASGADREIPITLASDFDQSRVRWVKEPFRYLTSAHISPSGDRIVLTARGQVFVAPVKQGRFVEVTRGAAVRYRSARFFPDGKSLSALSDRSGEVEFWQLDARGVAAPQQLTDGGKILRFDGEPSPDGKWIAFSDKNEALWLADVEKHTVQQIDANPTGAIGGLSWSPDSRWLLYGFDMPNTFTALRLYSLADGSKANITSDRFDHFSPAWSADGKWLAFLSNRNLQSIAGSPWGSYAPMPFLDQRTMIFLLPLQKGLRSPFQPTDELQADEKKNDKKDDKEKKEVTVTIERDGALDRLIEVPVRAGNYSNLEMTATHLYFTVTDISPRRETDLMALKLSSDDSQPQEIASRINGYELSADRKKILLRRGNELFVIDANGQKVQDLSKSRVNLSGWSFQVDPREDWRQLFADAWRLHRDYFYDPGMHGVDWPAMRRKYEPLVSRVTDRAELNNLIAQLISEVSALHASVRGGDARDGLDNINVASLGAAFTRDTAAGGFRVERIYRTDPDFPSDMSPLLQPGVDVSEGDVITAVNGVDALSVPDIGELLRNQTGRQVLLSVKDKSGAARQAVAVPISLGAEFGLRYSAWEYERRKLVDDWGKNDIGYVHLRAMGNNNWTEWAANFFPVYDRKALIIDVRHNNGGNIDSWILNTLLRRVWMWWKGRTGEVYPNMQYAYIGHVVVLVDEWTASDGEAFAEGFRRLGLGKLIGTRTWGGEIWLSGGNTQKDRGVATAAEFGVFADGQWLIEGHGVDPDVVVDNLPHATFNGEDAQLRAAVEHLQKLLRDKPVSLPKPPPYPDKSFKKP